MFRKITNHYAGWRQLYQFVFVTALINSLFVSVSFGTYWYNANLLELESQALETRKYEGLLGHYLFSFDHDAVESVAQSMLQADGVLSIQVEGEYGHTIYSGGELHQSIGASLAAEPRVLALHASALQDSSQPKVGQLIVHEVPSKNGLTLAGIVQIAVASFVLLFASILSVSSIYLRKHILQPVEGLLAAVQETVKAGSPVEADLPSDSIFGKFAHEFNRMQKHITGVQHGLSAANTELNKQTKTASEQALLLERILWSLHQSVVYYHADGQRPSLVFGDKAASVFDVVAEDTLPQQEPLMQALKAASGEVEQVTQTPRQHLNTGERYRLEVTRTDGRILAISALSVQGEGTALLSSDVTQQVRLEDSLRRAQKMEAMGILTGGVAHDFNNLLAIIQMCLELVLAYSLKSPQPAEISKEVETALDASKRASEVVKLLLSYSRSSELDVRSTDLSVVMREMKPLLTKVLGPEINIHVDLAEGLIAKLDSGLFKTALINLAANARDALDGMGDFYIRLFEEEPAVGDPEYLVVELKDSGPGIPFQLVDKVVDPFFTTKEPGKGTGLGLSMVSGYLAQVGGELLIDNALGGGARLRMRLPLDTGVHNEVDSPVEASEVASDALPHRKVRVLLVEDNDNLLLMMAKALSVAGHQVVEANSFARAKEMLSHAKNDPYDIVVADEHLGDGLGSNLLSHVAEDTPFIILSGNSRGIELDERVSLILNKPVRIKTLHSKVQELVVGG